MVAVDAAQLHDRVARSGRRGQRPAALELALPPGVRRRAADGRVGDGAGDQRRSVAELDAERVRAGTDEARDVVGAVLGGQLVVRVARSEDLVGHAPAVELGIVDADAREVQPRLGDLRATPPVDRERAREDRQRVARLRPGYSIHRAAPQSLRSSRPISHEAGRLHPVTSSRVLHTLTCQTTACRDLSAGPPHATSFWALERTLPESQRQGAAVEVKFAARRTDLVGALSPTVRPALHPPAQPRRRVIHAEWIVAPPVDFEVADRRASGVCGRGQRLHRSGQQGDRQHPERLQPQAPGAMPERSGGSGRRTRRGSHLLLPPCSGFRRWLAEVLHVLSELKRPEELIARNLTLIRSESPSIRPGDVIHDKMMRRPITHVRA